MDTNFWLATLLTESGGLQLEVILVDTVSEVPPLSSGNSLKIGWGGLSAHGDGVLDVDLSRFLSRGVPSTGNSVLYSGITGSGWGTSVLGSVISSAMNLASR